MYHYGAGLCAFRDGLDPLQAALVAAADHVVLAATLRAEQVACVQPAASYLADLDKTALVVGAKNFGWNNNAVMLLPESRRYDFHALPLKRVREANKQVSQAISGHPSLVFVDIMALLADEQGRVPVFTPGHRFISQDRTHFTRAGARWVGEQLLRHPAVAALAKDGKDREPASVQSGE